MTWLLPFTNPKDVGWWPSPWSFSNFLLLLLAAYLDNFLGFISKGDQSGSLLLLVLFSGLIQLYIREEALKKLWQMSQKEGIQCLKIILSHLKQFLDCAVYHPSKRNYEEPWGIYIFNLYILIAKLSVNNCQARVQVRNDPPH